jgi:hypothetical protein
MDSHPREGLREEQATGVRARAGGHVADRDEVLSSHRERGDRSRFDRQGAKHPDGQAADPRLGRRAGDTRIHSEQWDAKLDLREGSDTQRQLGIAAPPLRAALVLLESDWKQLDVERSSWRR